MRRLNWRVVLVTGGALACMQLVSASAQGGRPGGRPPGGQPGQPPPGQPGQPPPGGQPGARLGFGAPLEGLDAAVLALWQAGRRDFTERADIEDGLGPVFNGRSCAECHAGPAVGGSGSDLQRTAVTRFGRLVNGVFDPLIRLGGSVIQRRGLREVDPRIPVDGERVPREANVISLRAASPLFGAGLLEAVLDAEILAREDPADRNGDGISGAANRVLNPESGVTELGRFGWKAQVPTLRLFTGEAYLNELGITTPTFPQENLPQGRPIPPGADRAADPEEGGPGVETVAAFMRYLAPPPRGPVTANARRGEGVFAAAGCVSCHTPSLRTGGRDASVANRQAALYSDLLLHDMGDALADGIPQGAATGREWRTMPLWGTGARRNWLHDGRARSLDQAIRLHGGEGLGSARSYGQLSAADRDALLQFLASL